MENISLIARSVVALSHRPAFFTMSEEHADLEICFDGSRLETTTTLTPEQLKNFNIISCSNSWTMDQWSDIIPQLSNAEINLIISRQENSLDGPLAIINQNHQIRDYAPAGLSGIITAFHLQSKVAPEFCAKKMHHKLYVSDFLGGLRSRCASRFEIGTDQPIAVEIDEIDFATALFIYGLRISYDCSPIVIDCNKITGRQKSFLARTGAILKINWQRQHQKNSKKPVLVDGSSITEMIRNDVDPSILSHISPEIFAGVL